MIERPSRTPERKFGLMMTAVVLAGCSQGGPAPDRFHRAGMVSFKGQPVAYGEIQFLPDAKQGNRGPAGHAIIEQGRYDTLANGRGTVPGPHDVVILGYMAPPPLSEDAPDHATPLFPEYRVKQEMPMQDSTLDFEIPANHRAAPTTTRSSS